MTDEMASKKKPADRPKKLSITLNGKNADIGGAYMAFQVARHVAGEEPMGDTTLLRAALIHYFRDVKGIKIEGRAP